MRRNHLSLIGWVLALAAAATVQLASAAGEACSASQQCPKSSPCCGSGGTCGSGSLQCAGGCQPMASFTAGSCLPNPVCQDKNLTFAPADYNNPHKFWPILLYNGNPSNAPFTLDYGYLGKGPEGVLLELTTGSQAKISTTDYMLYGKVQLEARHDVMAGLVFAFITMSDTKDEIDWEFTTSDPHDLQTNYFSQGVVAQGTALSVNTSSIDVSDWHTYGLNWQPDKLQWTIDGKVLRTVTRNQAGNNYPRSPSRIQVSVWAGGNSTNPPGVIEWAGGEIDWTAQKYASQGYYSAEIKSFTTNCAAQSASGVSTVGAGNTTAAWVYTGKNSSSLDGPEFSLSTDPISFLKNPDEDGHFGLPGYTDQSAFTQSNKNAWDGSGDTAGLSSKEISGKSGGSSGSSSNSGGWLANNRTLSIAVPVIAAVAAVAAIWALAVWCCRRRRQEKAHNNELGSGILAKSGVPVTSTAYNAGASKGGRASRYHALYEEDEDAGGDPTPMGAQRVGQGYGPAVGPRPGPMNREEWSDSTSSLFDHKPYEYAGGNGNEQYVMNDRMRSPMPPATPATPGTAAYYDVRGPYTPGMNAYTPAVHQTPAMHTAFGSPQQVAYSTPQYTQRYAGRPPQTGYGGGQARYQQAQYPRYGGY